MNGPFSTPPSTETGPPPPVEEDDVDVLVPSESSPQPRNATPRQDKTRERKCMVSSEDKAVIMQRRTPAREMG
ncbi:MAG: hypothetical protein HOV80_04410 [Polyangiaceae bacterium]|nr:hypothetical protein [Polyangiaceae bacterium]